MPATVWVTTSSRDGVAVKNIDTFHTAQKLQVDVETLAGVRCQQARARLRPSASIFPRLCAAFLHRELMLATPARIAGCQKVVLCSPPPIADEILYAAKLCGVQAVYKVGGAQAISALAFGRNPFRRSTKFLVRAMRM